jgi:hypothetical protein
MTKGLKKIGGWSIAVAGFLWNLLDIIGRTEVATKLPHFLIEIRKFTVDNGLAWQLLPWAVMVFGFFYLAYLYEWAFFVYARDWLRSGRSIDSTASAREISSVSEIPNAIINEFESIKSPKLGKTYSMRGVGTAAQALHENATVIWLEFDHTLRILDNGSLKYLTIAEPVPAQGEKYFDDTKMRALTRTPNHKKPPLGGIAILWARDIPKWKKIIGYRLIHYHFASNDVYRMECENGEILGPFCIGGEVKRARFYVLLRTNEYSQITSQSMLAPEPVQAF